MEGEGAIAAHASGSPATHWREPAAAWFAMTDDRRAACLKRWFGPDAGPLDTQAVAACREWIGRLVQAPEVRLNEPGHEPVPAMSSILRGLARATGGPLAPYADVPSRRPTRARPAADPDDPEATADLHAIEDLLASTGASASGSGSDRSEAVTTVPILRPPADGGPGSGSSGGAGAGADAANGELLEALIAGWRGEAQCLRATLTAMAPDPTGALPAAPALADALARLIAEQSDVRDALVRAAHEVCLHRMAGWWFSLVAAHRLAPGVVSRAWSAIVERLAYRREASVALRLQHDLGASLEWPGIGLPPAAAVAAQVPAVPGRADIEPWLAAFATLERHGPPGMEALTRLWQHAVLECDGRADAEALAALHGTFARLVHRQSPSVSSLIDLLARLVPFRFAEAAVVATLRQLPALAGGQLPVNAGRVGDDVWARMWSGMSLHWRRVFPRERPDDASLIWRLLVVASDSGRLELLHRMLPALVRHLCQPFPTEEPAEITAAARSAGLDLVRSYAQVTAGGDLPAQAPPFWSLWEQAFERLEAHDGAHTCADEWLDLLVQAPPLKPREIPGAAEALGRAFRLSLSPDARDERLLALLARLSRADAPCLILSALAAVARLDPSREFWLRAVDALLAPLERFDPAWWLPLPGHAYGLLHVLVEGLLWRAQAGPQSLVDTANGLRAVWRRVAHDRDGRRQLVAGLAANRPAACPVLIRALLDDKEPRLLDRPPAASGSDSGSFRTDGVDEWAPAFAAAPEAWATAFAWAGDSAERQAWVGRRFERSLASMMTGGGTDRDGIAIDGRVAAHGESFCREVARRRAWPAYFAALAAGAVTTRLLGRHVTDRLWRSLAMHDADRLRELRDAVDADAAWPLVVRDGHAWPTLLHVFASEPQWLTSLVRQVWTDDPAQAANHARAIAAGCMRDGRRGPLWAWLRGLLSMSRDLPIEPWRDLVEPALGALVASRGSGAAFLADSQEDPAWRDFVGERGTQAGWETLLTFDHYGEATVNVWQALDAADRSAQTQPLLRACMSRLDWTALLRMAERNEPAWITHADVLLDGLLGLVDAARNDVTRWHSLLEALEVRGAGWLRLTRVPGLWARLLLAVGGEDLERVLFGALNEATDIDDGLGLLAAVYAALTAASVSERVREDVLRDVREAFDPTTCRLLHRVPRDDARWVRLQKAFANLGIDIDRTDGVV